MAKPGRELLQALMHRSSIAFMILVSTLLVASWVLIQDGTHGLRQAALAAAAQSSARAALVLKDEINAVEARLLVAQREGRSTAGASHAPLSADIAATLGSADPGQLRFWALPRGPGNARDVLAFLAPAVPGAPTASLRLPGAALEALMAPLPGTSLRLVTGSGTELAAIGMPGEVHTSFWVREGLLRVDGTATPGAMSLFVWLIPLFGLGTLGFIFRRHLDRSMRAELKLAALRGSLARHAAQLSVNEARMRLSQTERVATERRETALIEAWPGPVALVDPEGRVSAWNAAFGGLIPDGVLRRDLPLAMLSRHLDVQSSKVGGPARRGPGNRPRARSTVMADGSRMIEVLTDAPSNGMNEARHLCREELEARAPQLRDGVRAANGEAVRNHAHAMRGLAANFSLAELLPVLERMERAGQASDSDAMQAALSDFDREFEGALRQLRNEAA